MSLHTISVCNAIRFEYLFKICKTELKRYINNELISEKLTSHITVYSYTVVVRFVSANTDTSN